MTRLIVILRYLLCVVLMVWLGGLITLTFFVAPSLFSNASGVIQSPSMAGDIMSPLLHKMFELTLVCSALAILLLLYIARSTRPNNMRPVTICIIMLLMIMAAAWVGGVPITREIQEIRAVLKQDYGGYDKAPDGHPGRRRFAKLHGVSMMLVMGEIILGLSTFYFATQRLRAQRHRHADESVAKPLS